MGEIGPETPRRPATLSPNASGPQCNPPDRPLDPLCKGMGEDWHKHQNAHARCPLVPLAACCSRIFRVRGVVPLGMLIMYFPSISAVTRRRLVGTVKLSSRRAWAAGGDRKRAQETFYSHVSAGPPSLPCYLSPLSLMAYKALSCVSLCQHPNSMGQLESSMGGKVVQSSSRAGHQTPNPSFMHSREVPESWVLSPSYVKILLLWYLEPHPCGVQG